MIEVEDLRKQFVVRRGRFRRERRIVDAVDGISFRVGRGELLGDLGPNGAGKSSTT
jgi:ABC-2 type transport system ATP-binding protein